MASEMILMEQEMVVMALGWYQVDCYGTRDNFYDIRDNCYGIGDNFYSIGMIFWLHDGISMCFVGMIFFVVAGTDFFAARGEVLCRQGMSFV